MSYKVCQNPNCPSCGKPHPNCRCYAQGGEVVPEDDLPQSPSAEAKASPSSPDLSEITADNSVPHDDLPDGHEVPEGDLPESPGQKYGTLNQEIKAGLEGAGQGLAGPLFTYAEKQLGVDPADIKGRAEANPWIHGMAEAGTFAGSMFTGLGEAGLIAKGAGAASKATRLGTVGQGLVKGAIEGASFAGSDEITKAMLNQPGSDPEQPVSAALLHVGAAGLMGAATGGLFTLGQGMIGKGLEGLKSDKMVARVEEYLNKVGESGDPLGKIGASAKKYVPTAIADYLAKGSVPAYETLKLLLKPTIEKITDKAVSKANPYVTDAIIKAILTHETSGVPNAVHYATQVGKGAQRALQGIEALFKAGGAAAAPEVSEYAKEQLKKFIEDGQVEQQGRNQITEDIQPPIPFPAIPFAKGGEVKHKIPSDPHVQQPDRFANVFIEQNVLLNTAKARISAYLNNLRPLSNEQKLPFDEAPSDKEKKRNYDRALDFAVNPMKILHHVDKGDLTMEDMRHFTSMYPEVHRYLSQEMTKRITKAQMDGEKPPYKKRQAMSLFLGASLDTCVTPQAIMAAQNVFAQKRAQQQQAAKPKGKGTKALSKTSNSYLTDDQARETRQQKV